MIEEKRKNILTSLDILVNLKIQDRFLLTESQIENLNIIKIFVGSIDDESKLDTITSIIWSTLKDIYESSRELQAKINRADMVFLEHTERYVESKELVTILSRL